MGLTNTANSAVRLNSVLEEGREALAKFGHQFAENAISRVAEDIGKAIAQATNVFDAFKASIGPLLRDILVTAPKILGQILLQNALVTPPPLSLGLAATGIALIGLSGLLSGITANSNFFNPQGTVITPEDVFDSSSVSAVTRGLSSVTQTQTQRNERPEINFTANIDSDGIVQEISRQQVLADEEINGR